MGLTDICTTTDREYSKSKKNASKDETVGKLYFSNGCCEDIGMFSTEDIAREVLDEIWEKITYAKGLDVFYQIPEYR